MTQQELLQQIFVNDDTDALLAEIEKRLSAELEKPIEKQDYDLIDDLMKTKLSLTKQEQLVESRAALGIEKLKNHMYQQRRMKRIRRSAWIAGCACALVLVLSNVWSYSVWGMNAFSAAYRIIDGGINIDLTAQTEPASQGGNPYADEMRQICEEHDVDAKIPAYLPAGFTPCGSYGSVVEYPMKYEISFYFCRNKAKANYRIYYFYDQESISPIGIPTDTYNVSQQVIDGTTIHIIKEDDQFKAAWLIGTTEYSLTTYDLDYDESQRILESIFE